MDQSDASIEILEYASLLVSRKKYWTLDLDRLLRKWRGQISTRQIGHKMEQVKYKKIYYGLGLPVAILAAIISTAILSTFRNCDVSACVSLSLNVSISSSGDCASDEWVRLATGIVGVLSVVLSAANTFIDAGGNREKHKGAVDSYSELSHKIELLLKTPIILRGDPIATIQDVRGSFDSIVKDSPSIDAVYKTTLKYRTKKERGNSSPTVISIARASRVEEKEPPIGADEISIDFDPDVVMPESHSIKFDKGMMNALSFEIKRLNASNDSAPEEAEGPDAI
jgi:hypothetical protein